MTVAARGLAPTVTDLRLVQLTDFVLRVGPVLLLAFPLLVWPMAFTAFRPPTGTGTELSNVEASDSNLIVVLYILAASCVTLLAAIFRIDVVRRFPFTAFALLLVAYLGLAVFSLSWALEPSIAFRRLVQQVLIVSACYFVVRALRDPEAIARNVGILCGVVVVINILWLGVKPFSPIGLEGIYAQKNSLGAAMLVCIPFLAYAWLTGQGRNRLIYGLLLGGAYLLLMLSASKTSLGLALLVPCVTGLIYGLDRYARVPAALSMGLLGVAIGTLVIALVMDPALLPVLSESLLGDQTFTGRTAIWEFAAQQAELRPYLGYGFNSFWAIGYESPSEQAPGFIISLLQSHNGYIDIRLELGWIGLALAICLIVSFFFEVGANQKASLRWLSATVFSLAVLHNLLESSLFRGFNLMWIALLLAAGMASQSLRHGQPAPSRQFRRTAMERT